MENIFTDEELEALRDMVLERLYAALADEPEDDQNGNPG